MFALFMYLRRRVKMVSCMGGLIQYNEAKWSLLLGATEWVDILISSF